MRKKSKGKHKIKIQDAAERQEQDIFEEEWYDTVTTKLWQIILHNTEALS